MPPFKQILAALNGFWKEETTILLASKLPVPGQAEPEGDIVRITKRPVYHLLFPLARLLVCAVGLQVYPLALAVIELVVIAQLLVEVR
jgi:hypothetical protein